MKKYPLCLCLQVHNLTKIRWYNDKNCSALIISKNKKHVPQYLTPVMTLNIVILLLGCYFSLSRLEWPVASLRLASPGKWWCHLFTSKCDDLFSSFFIHCSQSFLTFFSHRPTDYRQYPLHLFTWSFAQWFRKFFFSLGCHPLDGVTRGGLSPSRPPSDATASGFDVQGSLDNWRVIVVTFWLSKLF